MVAEKKNTETALVVAQPAPAPMQRGIRVETQADLNNLGAMLAKSGYFKDARDAAQACVKVQAGMELGLPPVQSMTGIHIVEGKPTLSAGLIATLVKRSGKYNYRVTKHDDTECTIAFFEGREQIGVSGFSTADAERAGLLGNGTWKKYRRNMLFSRAMSNGARWYCPDIFGGPVYTAEELGAEVDSEGMPVIVSKPETPIQQLAQDVREVQREVQAKPADARKAGALSWAKTYAAKLDEFTKRAEGIGTNDDARAALVEEVTAYIEGNAKAVKALESVDARLHTAVRTLEAITTTFVSDLSYEPTDDERAALQWFESERKSSGAQAVPPSA